MKCKLEEICLFRMGKTNVANLTIETYISTENMLPNKSEIVNATSLPTIDLTQAYENGDVLVSNIRPYFKKIWKAKNNGGCSNDVLVFTAKENTDSDFLYYVLADDAFFAYAMATSKGTKMPRGDKKSIMQYEVPCYDIETQQKIAHILKSIDEKIELNNAINNNLEQQVQALFRNQFLTQETLPDGWIKVTLGEISLMGAGGDKPKTVSATQTENCPYPIYSNGISDEGLYGFTNEYKIKDESITVSARGTIGFVCLRHKSYTPIVRLVTLIPNTDVLSAKYLYLWLKNSPIHGTGTTQQQLTVPDFRKTEIILPTKEEMSSFTDTVTPLFEAMWANQDENTKLSKVRDSLLPKLMSGELDVSDIEL
mgnify:CR=1 FL=1